MGVCGGAKFFGSILLQPARNVCVSLSAFSFYIIFYVLSLGCSGLVDSTSAWD